jgi:hypothetical protein
MANKNPEDLLPPENQPGHHPEKEQDKPDPAAFVAKFKGEDRPESEPEPEPKSGPQDREPVLVGAAAAAEITMTDRPRTDPFPGDRAPTAEPRPQEKSGESLFVSLALFPLRVSVNTLEWSCKTMQRLVRR